VFANLSVQAALIFPACAVGSARIAVQASLVFPVFAVHLALFAVEASLIRRLFALHACHALPIFALFSLAPALRFELLLAHQCIAPAFQLLLLSLRRRAQFCVGTEAALATIGAHFCGVLRLFLSLQVPDRGPATSQRKDSERHTKRDEQAGFHRSFSG